MRRIAPRQIGADVPQSALIALSQGDRAGQIKLTEDEFSSLLRAVLVNATDEQTLIRDVQVWLEPDTVYLKILLREGAFPLIPTGMALNVEGGLRIADGRLRVRSAARGRRRHPLSYRPPCWTCWKAQLEVARASSSTGRRHST